MACIEGNEILTQFYDDINVTGVEVWQFNTFLLEVNNPAGRFLQFEWCFSAQLQI